MKPMICTQCGAKITVKNEDDVLQVFDVTIIRMGKTIKCKYCGTEFQDGHEFQNAVINTAFNQTGQTVGKQINIVGGRVGVIGDGLTIGKIEFG